MMKRSLKKIDGLWGGYRRINHVTIVLRANEEGCKRNSPEVPKEHQRERRTACSKRQSGRMHSNRWRGIPVLGAPFPLRASFLQRQKEGSASES